MERNSITSLFPQLTIQPVSIYNFYSLLLFLFPLFSVSKGEGVHTQTLVPGECSLCSEFLKPSNAPHWLFFSIISSWLFLCRTGNLFSLNTNSYLIQLVQ